MQAVMVREIGSFELTELPVPDPGPAEALVRVTVTGLCRTDLKVVRHGHRDLVLPRVPGEEVVGEVVAFGSALSGGRSPQSGQPAGASPCGAVGPAARVGLGDRVYVYPGTWCGTCPSCGVGAENLCREMRIMGFHRDGGFAEYVTAPLDSLIPVPEGLGDARAVFAEPLSCCLNALERGGVCEGDVLGVWGAGPAGTLLSRAAASRGVEVVVVEPDEQRRAAVVAPPPDAAAAGASGGRRGRVTAQASPPDAVDVAVVAVGSREAYEQAWAALAPRGRLVVFSGLLPADDTGVSGGFNRIHYHEHTVVGAYGCTYRHGVEALRLLADGHVRVDDMVTHVLPLAELGRGLDLVARRIGMKVLLHPRSVPVPHPGEETP